MSKPIYIQPISEAAPHDDQAWSFEQLDPSWIKYVPANRIEGRVMKNPAPQPNPNFASELNRVWPPEPEEWIDQIDAEILPDKKAFQDLTSISAGLLTGGRLDNLYAICERQSSVSTSKLQGLVDELRERDRKLALQLIALRDLGGDA